MLCPCSDASCPFSDSGGVQILAGGQVGTDDFLCSLFLSCLLADPNHTVMDMQRTDYIITLQNWIHIRQTVVGMYVGQ